MPSKALVVDANILVRRCWLHRICAAFPNTTERLTHGQATFFVRKKVFAMFGNNHNGPPKRDQNVPSRIFPESDLRNSTSARFSSAVRCSGRRSSSTPGFGLPPRL
jgi:hypothetical protein